jgi:hypothetical protein
MWNTILDIRRWLPRQWRFGRRLFHRTHSPVRAVRPRMTLTHTLARLAACGFFASCIVLHSSALSAADTASAKAGPAAKADDKSGKSSTDGAAGDLGQRKTGIIGLNDDLSFRQSKVAAEMTELEERMFRLSEALKKVEPENSSRLMTGVKYARDELILHEMQDIKDVLAKSDYNSASGEQKELLLKLKRLEQLLLSADLDLQMQLLKLRLMREILGKLDTAIKEEDREQKLSDAAKGRDAEAKKLAGLRETLEGLIRQQTANVKSAEGLTGQPSTQEKPSDDAKDADKEKSSTEKSSPEKLLTAQSQTRDETKTLEERLADVSQAREQMDKSLPPLEKKSVADALPHQKDALQSLEKLLAALKEQEKKAADELSQQKFDAMRKDQEQNHGATDKIGDMVRELGDSGASAIGEITRASGSMTSAESHLGQREPDPAEQNQSDASKSLKYARQQLSDEEQKLLNQIRAEVKKHVIEGVGEMLERQIAVRQSTERLSPRMKENSRQVLTAIVALAKSEEQIMQIGDQLITLVEESEFGIALPAALRAVTDEMDDVKKRLAAGDASEETIEAERQIEADLKALLEAMKQLPSNSPPKNSKSNPNNPDERERELNRLVAELKMIRILQVRVNHDTKQTDQKRGEVNNLSADLQRKIQAIHDRQQDVHDVTDKLNAQRGNELR